MIHNINFFCHARRTALDGKRCASTSSPVGRQAAYSSRKHKPLSWSPHIFEAAVEATAQNHPSGRGSMISKVTTSLFPFPSPAAIYSICPLESSC
jgi:hypothetical protein